MRPARRKAAAAFSRVNIGGPPCRAAIVPGSRTEQEFEKSGGQSDIHEEKREKNDADAAVPRYSPLYPHEFADDPRLPAELGDEPAALQGQQTKRGGEEDSPQEPLSGWAAGAAPEVPPEPGGGGRHQEKRPDH